MHKVVLDASAILALLNDEPGAEKITPELLSRATASPVNLAEVQTILVREGGDPDESWSVAVDPLPGIEPFTAEPPRKPHSPRPMSPTRSLHPCRPPNRLTTRRFPTLTGTNPALPTPSSTP